jgi:DNA-binding HxlR family transcriptional regulator
MSNLPAQERVHPNTEARQKAPRGNHSRRANPVSDCPLTAAFAAIGGKWKLILIYWLAESPKHFAALRRVMPSISQKVLTQQLRELIADEIVEREATGRAPAPVVYSLTEYGRSLIPLVESVRKWGRGHIERLSSSDPDLHL